MRWLSVRQEASKGRTQIDSWMQPSTTAQQRALIRDGAVLRLKRGAVGVLTIINRTDWREMRVSGPMTGEHLNCFDWRSICNFYRDGGSTVKAEGVWHWREGQAGMKHLDWCPLLSVHSLTEAGSSQAQAKKWQQKKVHSGTPRASAAVRGKTINTALGPSRGSTGMPVKFVRLPGKAKGAGSCRRARERKGSGPPPSSALPLTPPLPLPVGMRAA